mmetsp:Transcript_8097/g.21968  ORF Transcript_8097/g.21968 Transcript_8097/m.21968 type:complete len:276 (-) Transcript_8097:106-933(-)
MLGLTDDRQSLQRVKHVLGRALQLKRTPPWPHNTLVSLVLVLKLQMPQIDFTCLSMRQRHGREQAEVEREAPECDAQEPAVSKEAHRAASLPGAWLVGLGRFVVFKSNTTPNHVPGRPLLPVRHGGDVPLPNPLPVKGIAILRVTHAILERILRVFRHPTDLHDTRGVDLHLKRPRAPRQSRASIDTDRRKRVRPEDGVHPAGQHLHIAPTTLDHNVHRLPVRVVDGTEKAREGRPLRDHGRAGHRRTRRVDSLPHARFELDRVKNLRIILIIEL